MSLYGAVLSVQVLVKVYESIFTSRDICADKLISTAYISILTYLYAMCSQDAENLPTAASIAHLYAINAGVHAEDFGGNLDTIVQHNDNSITQLRTRIELMGVAARGRGDVSE